MNAIQNVTGTKMKSQAAGKMGYTHERGRRFGVRGAVMTCFLVGEGTFK